METPTQQTDKPAEPDAPKDQEITSLEDVPLQPAEAFQPGEDGEIPDGIYTDVPEQEYHALGRVSQSLLKKYLQTPAHAKARMDEEESEPSRSQRFGTACHTAILQPDLFRRTYAAGDCHGKKADGDRCTYSGKNPVHITDPEAAEEDATDLEGEGVYMFCGRHTPEDVEWAEEAGGVKTIGEDDQEKISRMFTAVRGHQAACMFLQDMEGLAELTVLWTHEETGLRCKSRIDRLTWHPQAGWFPVDYKTCRSAEPGTHSGTFGYDATKWGYHQQAAFYVDALASHGIGAGKFMIVAQEKQAPHCVVPYVVRSGPQGQEGPIDVGRQDMETALRGFAEHLEADSWPGYANGVVELQLPAWAYRE